MAPKIRSAPTPQRFATVWSTELERAARSVSRRSSISRAQAERIGNSDPKLRIYRDNVLNYLDAHHVDSAPIEDLVASGYRYALSEGQRVKGSNNRISLTEARRMAIDLRDDFRALRGAAPLPPEGPGPAERPSSREILASLADPVASLGEWWESGDNGVNVDAEAIPGAQTIEEALAQAPRKAPWTTMEAHLHLLDVSGADAIAAFNGSATQALNDFREEAHPEVGAFAQSVSEIFGRLDDVRLAHGDDLGGDYLFAKTSDGYALLSVQAYRDG